MFHSRLEAKNIFTSESERNWSGWQNLGKNVLIDRIWAKMLWFLSNNFENYFWIVFLSKNILIGKIWTKIFFDLKNLSGISCEIAGIWSKFVLISKIWAKRCWLAEFGLKLFTWHYLSKIVFDYHDLSENVMIVRIWAKLFYYSEFLRQNLNKTVLIERKCD